MFVCCAVLFIIAMPDTRAQRIKDFAEAAETAGLKDLTVRKLLDDDVDSVEVISLLSQADVTDFGFTRGQTLLLQKWVRSLQDQTTAEDTSTTGDEPASEINTG